MKRSYLFFLIGVFVLSACARADNTISESPPAEADTAENTQMPVAESTQAPPTISPPTDVPTPEPTPVFDLVQPILDVVLTRAGNADRVTATLFVLMSQPIPGGEMAVFHFEDILQDLGIEAGCSGHAILQRADDGSGFEVTGIAASCGGTIVEEPFTAFPSRGLDGAGGEVQVVYGEVYSSDVVAIRAHYGTNLDSPALISNGGYIIILPLDALVSSVIAYDSAGAVIYETPVGGRN